MTYFPDYLKQYPNMYTTSPLHMSLNSITSGFRAHRHDFLEFSYVISGSGTESINGKLHPMKPGTFTFVLPYQVHQIYTDQGSEIILYNCMFSMNLLMEANVKNGIHQLLDEMEASSFFQFEGKQNDEVLQLVSNMYKEYIGNEPWRETMLVTRLKELLITFDRNRKQYKQTQQKQLSIINTKSLSFWQIIYYIYQHYQEDLTLSLLSKKYNMSISRISEVIKETTGQTFVNFLNDIRLRHACSLLVSTEMSVSEIAMEVGYVSYTTFSRVFRKDKGMTPKEYRKINV